MSGFLFLPIMWAVLWLANTPSRVVWQSTTIWLIVYFTMRLLANLIMDRDAEHARLMNSREHFGRPSFAIWRDKDGKIQVRSGPNPDHATRCQNSRRSWHKIERRIKWNNWIYAGWIIVLALVLERI